MTDCACDMSLMTPETVRTGVPVCAWCGGQWVRSDGAPYLLTDETAAGMRHYLEAGGLVVLVYALDRVVYVDPTEVLAAPGTAKLHRCQCGDGMDGALRCDICDGTARELYHACVNCGDVAMWAWDGDRAHMACDLCRARWDAADPRWIAQRVPQRLLVAAAAS